jgi:hypothetical protein
VVPHVDAAGIGAHVAVFLGGLGLLVTLWWRLKVRRFRRRYRAIAEGLTWR